MPKFIDLTGQSFGGWKALKYLGNSRWLCEDSNGNKKDIHSYELRKKYKEGVKPKGIMPAGFLHKKFNKWYVEEYLGGGFWKCTCECGNTGKVNSFDLTHNKSTQCKECSSKRQLAEDLTGKTFGLWTVQYYAGNMKWHCICGCEAHTERDVMGRDLRNGISKSCGCNRDYHIIHKDITGQTFGNLEVIEYTGKDQMWRCRCNACGKENVIVFRDSLVSGKTKSCGCLKEQLRKETLYKRYGDTNTTRSNNPREDWQIKVLESKENLVDYINTFDYKPTAFELSQYLDVHDTTMLKALRKYDIMELVQDVNAGVSAMELQLAEFVKSFGYEVIQRSKSVIPPYEIDIYIPEKKLAIEFNGDYWHSSEFKEYNYHQKKTIECIKNGVHLIHIFEYEWLDTNKKEKILNYIRYKLSKSSIVYGRSTEIHEVSSEEASTFCDKYHMQGGVNCTVNIGCFYNSELIGVMTFGKPRFDSNAEYELIRLCWLPNYNIVGGTEKLFKYFVTKYKPDSIISYCDLTKFTGNSYLRLGFKTKSEWLTKPNYVWVNKRADIVLTRYQTQKHKLIEIGLGTEDQTEDEIMYNNDYIKIYNSGNIKFIWNSELNNI
jgi:hypothetical protein